jgi:hypothetical protein
MNEYLIYIGWIVRILRWYGLLCRPVDWFGEPCNRDSLKLNAFINFEPVKRFLFHNGRYARYCWCSGDSASNIALRTYRRRYRQSHFNFRDSTNFFPFLPLFPFLRSTFTSPPLAPPCRRAALDAASPWSGSPGVPGRKNDDVSVTCPRVSFNPVQISFYALRYKWWIQLYRKFVEFGTGNY